MKKIYMADKVNFALIDDEDYELISSYKWHICKPRNIIYAQCRLDEFSLYMHRIILNLNKGDKNQVDHINGNGLDNRKNNLRKCNHSLNGANRKSLGGYSIFKGVSFDKKRNLWTASLRFKYRRYNLGRFIQEKEAALAYDEFAYNKFGDFAKLNFPLKLELIEQKNTI